MRIKGRDAMEWGTHLSNYKANSVTCVDVNKQKKKKTISQRKIKDTIIQ
jgi:hypothetical protein